jgi:hypothetical protein
MYSLLHSGSACCGQCRYFKVMNPAEETEVEIESVDVDAGEYGRCVRYPPALFHPNLLNGEFPVVSAATWCGEFKRDLE